MGIVEAKEHLENDADLVTEPGQDADALIGSAGIDALGTGREGENHHERRDDDDARDDGKAHIDARAAAIEQRVEDAQKHRLVR